MAGNQVTLNLITRARKSFDLILTNFAFAYTLLATFDIKTKLTLLMSVVTSISKIITIKKIKMVVSKMSLIGKQIQTINLKRVRIVSYLSERVSFVFVTNERLVVSLLASLRQKANSAINIKQDMITSVLLATFYTLGTYDVETLGYMDVITLGDLDYLES